MCYHHGNVCPTACPCLTIVKGIPMPVCLGENNGKGKAYAMLVGGIRPHWGLQSKICHPYEGIVGELLSPVCLVLSQGRCAAECHVPVSTKQQERSLLFPSE